MLFANKHFLPIMHYRPRWHKK